MNLLSFLRFVGMILVLLFIGGVTLLYGFTHRIYEHAQSWNGQKEFTSSATKKEQSLDPFGVGFATRPLQPFSILFLGVDSRKGEQARADSIMFAVVNPEQKDLHILPIPRDTYVQVPGYGKTKINHAMFYGGVPLMKETVSRFLNEPVHYAVVLDFEGFRRVVDELGGIRLTVEKNMDYDDPTDGTHIHLRKGEQWVNGKMALDYSRFRYDVEADTGRMRRQQQVLRAMIQEGRSADHWSKWFHLTQILGDHVKTDLPPVIMVSLAKEYANHLTPEQIHTVTIQGVNRVYPSDGLWYFFVSEKERNRLHEGIEQWMRGMYQNESREGKP